MPVRTVNWNLDSHSYLHSCLREHSLRWAIKVKVKVVNLYSASSCIHTSNALFVTNQSCQSHSRCVQPANTGWCTGRLGSPVSCTKVPTFRNPYNGLLTYYSFNRPWRDGRLSWPCWLTDSERRTNKVVKQPSISLAQDKESPPARTDILTTMLRHQLFPLGHINTGHD